MKSISVLLAAMVVGLMAITTFGCGDYAESGNTPSQIVEKYYQLTQKNDCQKVADLVNDTNAEPQRVDRFVNDCKKYADNFVSYSIKEETFDESGNFARVDTEVTLKEDGGNKTNSPTHFLVKRDDDWKLTEIP
jgi:hypothetical protein